MLQLISVLFILCASIASLDRHFYKSNDSFALKCITPNWSRLNQKKTDPIELEPILNQPFTYLDKGLESFVFLSEDQKWVIKFIRLPKQARKFSFKIKPSDIQKAHQRLLAFYQASKDLKSTTGVVYAHTSQTSFLPHLELIDRLQTRYQINLNNLPFIIQKRATPFFEELATSKSPKNLIASAVQIYRDLYELGYMDADPSFEKNFGVAEDTPMIIDIGKLHRSNSPPSREEYLEKMTVSLRDYLQSNAPEHLTYYKNLLH